MACPICWKRKCCGWACKCTREELLDYRLKKNPMKLKDGKVIDNVEDLNKETENLVQGNQTGYWNSKWEFILTR